MIKNSLLLTTLLTLPSINGALANASINTNSIELNIDNDEEVETRRECTFMYVGKDCSETGMAIVARTGDSPKGINHNMKIVEHNELANKTVEGHNGFKYNMPSTTYRYVASPRSRAAKASNYWEVSCVNEKGVTVSATLSTSSNTKALTADPQFETGIGEDNLAQVVAATSATAREGVLHVADVMANQGSCESNAIMIQDKDEVWYMELYTGRRYCAVKLPDDKCCTIGNEFLLNTLDELGINANNFNEKCICSDDLESFAKEKGFAKYDGSTEDIYHLHLFNTYAGDTNESGVEVPQGGMVNGCHMRTWRGRDMFAIDGEKANYDVKTKYSAMFTPSRKLGVNDIKDFMRDRFESILEGTGTDHEYFVKVLTDEGKLRTVGTETAYQIHIMMVNPNLPSEVAATEWVCLSNSCYAPFVPFNAGINSMTDYYSHEVSTFGYDEDAAICIYRNLNTLAKTAEQTTLSKSATSPDGKKYYGDPTREFIEDNEDIWQAQYYQIIQGLDKYNLSQQKQIVTNYSKLIQYYAINLSKSLFQQLSDHIEWVLEYKPKESAEGWEKKVTFKPLVNLSYYSWVYGWNCSIDSNNVATLNKDNDKITINLNYGFNNPGKIKKNDDAEESINVVKFEDMYYIDSATAASYMSSGGIAQLNLNDYLDPANPARIVIPVVLSVALVTCLAIIFVPIISKKVKAKKAAKLSIKE